MKNFTSHIHSKVSFENEKIVLVKGISNNINKSNGSGKSSIFEAIIFGIFGNLITNSKNLTDIIRLGEKELFVKLTFIENETNDKIEIERKLIRRTRSNSHDVNLYINDEPKNFQTKNHLQKFIENKLIGTKKEIFKYTNLLMSNSESILSFSPTNKTKLFEEILNIDIFDKMYNVVNDDIKSLNEQYILTNSKSEDNQRTKESLQKTLEKMKLTETQKEIDKYDDEIEEIDNKIEDLINDYKEKVEEYGKQDDIKNDNKKINDKINKITNEIIDIKSKIKSNEKYVKEKKGLLDINKCPTCEREIDEDLKKSFDDYLNKLKKELSELKKDLKKKNEEVKDSKDTLKDNKNKIEEIQKFINNKNFLTEKKIRLEEQKKKFLEDLNKNNNKDEDNELKKQIDNIDKKINKLKKEIKELELKKTSLNGISKLLSPKSSLRIKYIEQFLNILMYISEKYIDIFYEGNDIKFNVEYDIDLRSIYVSLDMNGIKKNYFQLSTGEKRKLDIIFYLSILEYLYNYTHGQINLGLVIFDESADGLDITSSSLLVDCLEMFSKEVDTTIMFTSHNNSLPIHIFEKVITVKKDDNTQSSKIINNE